MDQTLNTAHYTAMHNLVRELAESDAAHLTPTVCRFCFARLPDNAALPDHDPTCLWVRAKALVQ